MHLGIRRIRVLTPQNILYDTRTVEDSKNSKVLQKYFARGHLTPDSDRISKSWRDATYFYMNTVPMWQRINNGIWKRIENAARSVASGIGNNIQVYTGGFQSQGDLTVNGVEVPKWLFKVVVKPGAGIAFVTLNDINARSVTLPCKDICDENGWLKNADRKDYSKGYTICCSVDEFQRNFINLKINSNVHQV
jgi:DNA/RNA endonuclease G (NUC1)